MPIILVASLAIIAAVTWLLSQEGIWGAASTLVCVVVSGLVAMNYFEPLALILSAMVPAIMEYADFVALVGLFAGLVFGLRTLTEHLAPVDIRVPDLLDTIGKWGFGAATGYVTMAFLLTALHTAPLSRNIFDFQPEQPAFFGMFPDRQWLAFTQHVSENSMPNPIMFDQATRRFSPNIFDGQVKKIGDSTNTVWASFPIRYATRRSLIEQGQFAGAAGGGGAAKGPGGAPPPPPQGGGARGPAQGGF